MRKKWKAESAKCMAKAADENVLLTKGEFKQYNILNK